MSTETITTTTALLPIRKDVTPQSVVADLPKAAEETVKCTGALETLTSNPLERAVETSIDYTKEEVGAFPIRIESYVPLTQ